ncbi:MAG TPA: patatin-like phospholipase family protein [Chitinophagaceae bacterium]|nr:patatin-like phospholipase family protein [Chitinophagaceae bacterium]
MKAWLRGFIFSFPVQLLFLHIRKYQVILVFWFVLFSTVNGTFMHTFGADSLFLAPEYLGSVNAIGAGIVGISVGMFIMSWNITSFILFSRHFKFLAATTNPFLKYCTNNFGIPLLFLLFYFFKTWQFIRFKELISTSEYLMLAGGFLSGLLIMLLISFIYFFRADRSIYRRMMPVMNNPREYITYLKPGEYPPSESKIIKVEWYLDTPITVRKARDVSHYTRDFIENIFKRHHFVAVLSVFAAFLFLVGIGFLQDSEFFQIPAAASITIFFAVLIGVSGAFTYFLQSWSIPYMLGLIILINFFYKWNWIDPRNKAFGINYTNKNERPAYNRDNLLAIASAENITADSLNMIQVLENWKKKQQEEKPLFVVMSTSGGGHRSATFTMNVLQRLDSITGGEFMKKTFLITGASGGMIGASYFRELYLKKEKGENIKLQDKKYVDDIAGDLLNPLFSSFITRDIISPATKFKAGPYIYVKDRAYAFESKLNANTNGFLNKQLKDYRTEESNAAIPLAFYNSVISRDGRKVLISTQPVRFMMMSSFDNSSIPAADPDIIDFTSFFARQDPFSLRILSALRMNATFPVVLPNVWLPSDPVIDVMDAGLRDNYGQETALRFLEFFDDWLKQNTRAILIVQMRDRPPGGWEIPYVTENIGDHITKPFLLLQHNWFKMMDFFQSDMLRYYARHAAPAVHKIIFQYSSEKKEDKAALNFHLTQREKNQIMNAPDIHYNQESFERLVSLFNKKDSILITPVE